jgi:hypothetical protein
VHVPIAIALGGLILAAPHCRGQEVVGKPCLFSDYFAEWRTFPSILRDAGGNLACGRHRLNHGGATQAPPAAGNVAATAIRRIGGGPQGHFTYRDAGGAIHDLWFERYREKDRWHAEQLNRGGRTGAPAAAGDPSGVEFRGEFHVVYRDLAGGIQDLWCGGAWQARRLGSRDAPRSAGEPVQSVHGEVRHVLYRDLDGNLLDLLGHAPGRPLRLNAGGATDAPPAAGDPVLARVGQACHVLYRDLEGGIQDLWDDGSWHVRRLNAGGATDAPLAQGEPCARVVEGRTLHVTYRDAAGNLQDLQSGAPWQAQRLNRGGLTDAPPAGADPVCLVPPSNWEYVAYVDITGNAQLLSRGQDGPWRATWLNAPDLRFVGGTFLP